MQRSSAQRVTRRLLPSLAYRDFRYLWMTTLSSSGAAWGLIVARGWLVYDLSESSVWVGVTTFAAMIPLFLVPPFAGFLADKFQRRRLLGYVFVLQLAHNAVLAALALTGVIEPWHLVVLAFFNGSARARADAHIPLPAAQPGAQEAPAQRHRIELGDDAWIAAAWGGGCSATVDIRGSRAGIRRVLDLLHGCLVRQ